MSSFRESLSKEFFVGIFVTVGFFLLVGSIYTIEGLDDTIQNKQVIKVKFDYLGGLKTGQPVLYAGYQVGTVKSVNVKHQRPPSIITKLAIPKGLPVYTNSKFYISSSGLIGDKVVDILPPDNPAQRPDPGDVLKGQSPVNMSRLLGRLQNVFGDGTRSKIKTTIDNTVRLSKNLVNLSKMAKRLTINNKDQVNQIIDDFSKSSKHIPGLVKRADKAARSLDELATKLSQISGENRTQVRRIIKNLEMTSDNLKQFSKEVKDSPSMLFWGK